MVMALSMLISGAATLSVGLTNLFRKATSNVSSTALAIMSRSRIPLSSR